MMRDAARSFARDEVAPRCRAMDEAGKMEGELIEALFHRGFMGIEVDEKYGGSGSSFTAALLVVEELARADPAVSVMVDIHNTIVNNCFSSWASLSLKEEWLPKLASTTLGAFALSEAGSGSDAFALKTTARREGDEFVLNGEKMWISNSSEAGVFLLMANSRPDAGYKGITCFVVPADSLGLTVGRREDKLGIKASSTCPIRLEDVRVPASNILGTEGMGYKYAIDILNEGRIGIGAQMVGLAQVCALLPGPQSRLGAVQNRTRANAAPRHRGLSTSASPISMSASSLAQPSQTSRGCSIRWRRSARSCRQCRRL